MKDINTIVNENVTLKTIQGGKEVKALEARQRIGATLYKTQKAFAGVDAKQFIENPAGIIRKSPNKLNESKLSCSYGDPR